MAVKSFEQNCRCHQEQISSASLNLLTVPEFEENPFSADTVAGACGIEGSEEEFNLHPLNRSTKSFQHLQRLILKTQTK